MITPTTKLFNVDNSQSSVGLYFEDLLTFKQLSATKGFVCVWGGGGGGGLESLMVIAFLIGLY